MYADTRQSCWGAARVTLVAFAVAVGVLWLFGALDLTVVSPR